MPTGWLSARDASKPHAASATNWFRFLWRVSRPRRPKCKMSNIECRISKFDIRYSTLDIRCRSWRRPTLPRPRDRSTIGADRLNDRVRDGNGCGPVALVASRTGGWGLGPMGLGFYPQALSPRPDF